MSGQIWLSHQQAVLNTVLTTVPAFSGAWQMLQGWVSGTHACLAE
jgi:hypothetical protein